MAPTSNIEFVDYDSVTEKVIVIFNDLSTGIKREELTVWAYKSMIENPNDPSYSERSRKITKAIEQKGGMDWLRSQIESHLRKQIHNTED